MTAKKILIGFLVLLMLLPGCIQNSDEKTTTTASVESMEVANDGKLACLKYVGSIENGAVFDTNIVSSLINESKSIFKTSSCITV